MKRLIATAMLLLSTLAAAQDATTPGAARVLRNNDPVTGAATGMTTTFLAMPPSGAQDVVYLDGTTRLPKSARIGAGLSIASGTITATQVPADWAATTGTGVILNKPSFATVAYSAEFMDLTNRPTTYAPSAHTHVIADVTGLQSALDGKQPTIGFTPYNATNPAGYITSAALTGYATTGSLFGYATTSELTTGLAGKLNTPTGTAAQYVRGDGTLATLPATPTVPAINRVRATTAADGTYAWTLPTACPAGTLPIVSITPESATAGDSVSHRIVSTTNTTVNVFAGRSAGLTVLSLTVLGVPTGAAIPLHMIAICP